MKKIFVLTAAILAAILLNQAAIAAQQSLTEIPAKPAAPAFKLIDLDELEYSLEGYAGKPLIINFWATWCPPCREEMPSMERAWQKIQAEGIGMVGINVGETFDQVFGFTSEYDVSFPLLLDTDGKATKKWPIRGLPTTFILNGKGEIVYQAIGGRDWEDEKILGQIRALIPPPS